MPDGFVLDWERMRDLAAFITHHILWWVDIPRDPFVVADETAVLLTGALVTHLGATSGAQFEAVSFSGLQDRLRSCGIEVERREGATGGEQPVRSYVFRSEGRELEIQVRVPAAARAAGIA